MPKLKKLRSKRVRNLIVIFSLTAIILSVSTYAWFIGMRTVNVSSFDVEIASTDSLLLSLNGQKWDTTVNISQANVNDTDVVYEGNTNTWGGAGLIPVSSIGAMDNTASRMKLFEKASLTSTPGGYRLMASRVNNYQTDGEGKLTAEQDGYVAFDLFIKNFSGTQYIKALNELDEEAIYLTTDSAVTVAETGGVGETGIENSVRVAFAQIGRVAGTTTNASTITGITCNPAVDSDVTGICRTAQIWEPNDTKHVANAISWYTTSCKTRKAVLEGQTSDVTKAESYEGNCLPVTNTNAYDTYAIGSAITSANNVNIYDGEDYNTFTGSSAYLTAFPYFTDTMKMKTSTNRPTFMTLSPNSITKVRIYIYIEGQDVDNYDFASIGKKISVKFGFTKERYAESDVYSGNPPLNASTDTVKPVITLNGNSAITVDLGSTYEDAGATATDNEDTNMTAKIHVINPVDTSKAGVYTVTYNVSDWAGNYADQVTRTVTVQ